MLSGYAGFTECDSILDFTNNKQSPTIAAELEYKLCSIEN